MEDVKENKGINRFWTIWNLSEDVILLAAGVLAIVVGCIEGNDNLRNVINSIITYAIAGFIILDGLLRLIMTLLKVKRTGEESIMLVSGFEITLGIVIMVVLQKVLVEALVYFIAVGTIVVGAMFLAFSIVSLIRKSTENYAMPILEIIFGGILIGVGIYIIILYNINADAKERICLALTGTVISIVAVALAIITIVSGVKRKKKAALVPVDQEEVKKPKKEKKSKKKAEPVEEEPVETNEPIDVEAEEKVEEPKAIEGKVKEIEHKPDDEPKAKDDEGKAE